MQKVAHWSDSDSYFLSDENYIGFYTHFFPISDPISERKKSDGLCEQAVIPVCENKIFSFQVIKKLYLREARLHIFLEK